MKKALRLITIIFFLAFIFVPSKGNIIVNAKLDSVNITMGNLTTLHLEVVKNSNQTGDFPILKNSDRLKGYIGVCGDSVELRTSYKTDTVEIGSGRIQINYEIPVQAFDSGTYRLPEFIYVAGKDSAGSNRVTFNVLPVNVTAEDQIAGFASVMEPEGKRFYDVIPDWILDFWWIFIVIVLAICAFYWGMRRYRDKGTLLPVKPALSPYERAINALIILKEKKLWEKGQEKEYFTDLTDILRTYLEQRFGINAMEMTTRQIISTLNNSDVRDKKDYIREILNVADFVKFAKVRPLPSDNIKAFDNAMKFVEETKPAAISEENSSESENDSKGGQKI